MGRGWTIGAVISGILLAAAAAATIYIGVQFDVAKERGCASRRTNCTYYNDVWLGVAAGCIVWHNASAWCETTDGPCAVPNGTVHRCYVPGVVYANHCPDAACEFDDALLSQRFWFFFGASLLLTILFWGFFVCVIFGTNDCCCGRAVPPASMFIARRGAPAHSNELYEAIL